VYKQPSDDYHKWQGAFGYGATGAVVRQRFHRFQVRRQAANLPVGQIAIVPETSTRNAGGTISSRRFGARARDQDALRGKIGEAAQGIDHDQHGMRIERAFGQAGKTETGDHFVEARLEAEQKLKMQEVQKL
jgi:hypothetical protein